MATKNNTFVANTLFLKELVLILWRSRSVTTLKRYNKQGLSALHLAVKNGDVSAVTIFQNVAVGQNHWYNWDNKPNLHTQETADKQTLEQLAKSNPDITRILQDFR